MYFNAILRSRGREATALRKRGASGAPNSAPRIIEIDLKRSPRVGTMPAASISTRPFTSDGRAQRQLGGHPAAQRAARDDDFVEPEPLAEALDRARVAGDRDAVRAGRGRAEAGQVDARSRGVSRATDGSVSSHAVQLPPRPWSNSTGGSPSPSSTYESRSGPTSIVRLCSPQAVERHVSVLSLMGTHDSLLCERALTEREERQPCDWGAEPAMSDMEALMWRSEASPRLRSGGVILDILDKAPDWDRLRPPTNGP